MLKILLAFALFLNFVNSKCPEEWTAVENRCLFKYPSLTSFSFAEQYCRAVSAKILHADDVGENSVKDFMKANFANQDLTLTLMGGPVRQRAAPWPVISSDGQPVSLPTDEKAVCVCANWKYADQTLTKSDCACANNRHYVCNRVSDEQLEQDCAVPLGLATEKYPLQNISVKPDTVNSGLLPLFTDASICCYKQVCQARFFMKERYQVTKIVASHGKHAGALKELRLLYSDDDKIWHRYSIEQIFLNDTVKTKPNGMDAKQRVEVNIQPINFHHLIVDSSINPGGCTLRLELYGCNGPKAPPPKPVTKISGVIESDTSWTAQQGIIEVTNSITIPTGVTLKIGAGVQVLVAQNVAINVFGSIQTSGLAQLPVKFASSSPATDKKLWDGIKFQGTAVAQLSHTIFEDAKTAVELTDAAKLSQANGLRFYECQNGLVDKSSHNSVLLSDLQALRISETAVLIEKGLKSSVSITNVHIKKSKTGVAIRANGTVSVTDSTFEFCSSYGLEVQDAQYVLDATLSKLTFKNNANGLLLHAPTKYIAEFESNFTAEVTECLFEQSKEFHLRLDARCFPNDWQCPAVSRIATDLTVIKNSFQNNGIIQFLANRQVEYKITVRENSFTELNSRHSFGFGLHVAQYGSGHWAANGQGAPRSSVFIVQNNKFRNITRKRGLQVLTAWYQGVDANNQHQLTVQDNQFQYCENIGQFMRIGSSDGIQATGLVSGNTMLDSSTTDNAVEIEHPNITFNENSFENVKAPALFFVKAKRTRPLVWYDARLNYWQTEDAWQIRNVIIDFEEKNAKAPVLFSPYWDKQKKPAGSKEDNGFTEKNGLFKGIVERKFTFQETLKDLRMNGSVYIMPEGSLEFRAGQNVSVKENSAMLIENGHIKLPKGLVFRATDPKKRWQGIKWLESVRNHSRTLELEEITMQDCNICLEPLLASWTINAKQLQVSSCSKALMVTFGPESSFDFTNVNIEGCSRGLEITANQDTYTYTNISITDSEIDTSEHGIVFGGDVNGNFTFKCERDLIRNGGIWVGPTIKDCGTNPVHADFIFDNITVHSPNTRGIEHAVYQNTYCQNTIFNTSILNSKFNFQRYEATKIHSGYHTANLDYNLTVINSHFEAQSARPANAIYSYYVYGIRLHLFNNSFSDGSVRVAYMSKVGEERQPQCEVDSNLFNSSFIEHPFMDFTGTDGLPVCDITKNEFISQPSMANTLSFSPLNMSLNENSFEDKESGCFLHFKEIKADFSRLTIDATRNYWGSNEPLEFRDLICDKELNPQAPTVEFSPYYEDAKRSKLTIEDDSFKIIGNRVSGVVRDAQTIPFSQNNYTAEGRIFVTSTGTLKVEPGVTLQFGPNAGIVVEGGALDIEGTEEDPITFEGMEDDKWAGIKVGPKEEENLKSIWFKEGKEPKQFMPLIYYKDSYRTVCWTNSKEHDLRIAQMMCSLSGMGDAVSGWQDSVHVNYQYTVVFDCPVGTTDLKDCKVPRDSSCYGLVVNCTEERKTKEALVKFKNVIFRHAQAALEVEKHEVDLRDVTVEDCTRGLNLELFGKKKTLEKLHFQRMEAEYALGLRLNYPKSQSSSVMLRNLQFSRDVNLGLSISGQGSVLVESIQSSANKFISMAMSSGSFILQNSNISVGSSQMGGSGLSLAINTGPGSIQVLDNEFTSVHMARYRYALLGIYNSKNIDAQVKKNKFHDLNRKHIVHMTGNHNSNITVADNDFIDGIYESSAIYVDHAGSWSMNYNIEGNNFKNLQSQNGRHHYFFHIDYCYHTCSVAIRNNVISNLTATNTQPHLVYMRQYTDAKFIGNELHLATMTSFIHTVDLTNLTVSRNRISNATGETFAAVQNGQNVNITRNQITNTDLKYLVSTVDKLKENQKPIIALGNQWPWNDNLTEQSSHVVDFHSDYTLRRVIYSDAETTFSAVAQPNGTMRLFHKEVLITQSIFVARNSTLFIGKGTKLIFLPGRGIQVYGRLAIDGEQADGVQFLAFNGSWAGINIHTPHNLTIRNALLSNFTNSLSIAAQSVTIHQVKFRNFAPSGDEWMLRLNHREGVFSLVGLNAEKTKFGILVHAGSELVLADCHLKEVQSVIGFSSLTLRKLIIENNRCESCAQLFAINYHQWNYGIKQTMIHVRNNDFVNSKSGSTGNFIQYKAEWYTNIPHDFQIVGNKFENISVTSIWIRVAEFVSEFNMTIAENEFKQIHSTAIFLHRMKNWGSHNYNHELTNVRVLRNQFLNSKVSSPFIDIQVFHSENIGQFDSHIEKNVFQNCSSPVAIQTAEETSERVMVDLQENVFLANSFSKATVQVKTYNTSLNKNLFSNNISTIYDLQIEIPNKDIEIDATNNWWNSDKESIVKQRILDGSDIGGKAIALYKPFKTSAGYSCASSSNCNGHGYCIGPDICKCTRGWTGTGCEQFNCDNRCYGNGKCTGPNQCNCYAGWIGQDCLTPICRSSCSGSGLCVGPDQCHCFPAYKGADCSVCAEGYWGRQCQQCPACQNGACTDTGKCKCDAERFTGALCNQCVDGYIGVNCEQVPYVEQIIPVMGPDTGSTTVTVLGFNLPSDKDYECSFGKEKVPATWISSNKVQCKSPKHAEGIVSFKLTDIHSVNELSFTFQSQCGSNDCGAESSPSHGYCAFGSCVCKTSWYGNNCGQGMVAPEIQITGPDTMIEYGRYIANVELKQGTEPMSWILQEHPMKAVFDTISRKIEWTPEPGDTIGNFKLSASNKNGATKKEWTVTVTPSFSARVTSISVKGTLPYPHTVTINGTVSAMNSKLPAVDGVPVLIRVKSERTDRVVLLDGWADLTYSPNFWVTFFPSKADVGKFVVDAIHPSQKQEDIETQASWHVLGMQVQPSNPEIELFIEDLQGPYEIGSLINTGSQPLINVMHEVLTVLPKDVSLKFGTGSSPAKLLSANLDPGKSVKLNCWPTVGNPIRGKIAVQVGSEQGTKTYFYLNFYFTRKRSAIQLNPRSLSGNVIRGKGKLFTIELKNTGSATASDIQVELPENEGFNLVALTNDLPPGNSTTLTLSYFTPADTPLGTKHGSIVVKCRDSRAGLPVNFVIASDSHLDYRVIVEDEYTYFAEDKPLVSGATVQLYAKAGSTLNEVKTTGIDGVVLFENITEAFYNLIVTEDNHASWRGVVHVKPSEPNRTIFLQRRKVKVKFSVKPTPIKDEYVITLESSFETNVPMPVVSVKPQMIDLVPLEQGKVKKIDFTVTNLGLIAADNFGMTPPTDHPFLSFEAEGLPIERIPANTTYTITMHVKRKARVKRSTGRKCCYENLSFWSYFCNGPHKDYQPELICKPCKSFPDDGDSDCAACGGRRVGWDPGSFPGDWGGISFGITSPISCECARDLLRCILTPVKIWTSYWTWVIEFVDIWTEKGTIWKKIVHWVHKAKVVITWVTECAPVTCSCGKDMGGAMGFDTSGIECKGGFDGATTDEGFGRKKRSTGGVADQVAQRLLASASGMEKWQHSAELIFNGSLPLDMRVFYPKERLLTDDILENNELYFQKIVEVALSEFEAEDWQNLFWMSVSDQSTLGNLISEQESNNIIEAAKQIGNETEVFAFIYTWNVTKYYWSNGQPEPLGTTSERVVSYQALSKARKDVQLSWNKAKEHGFNSILDWFNNEEQAASTFTDTETMGGVCAVVRIRISQRAVLTRDAFTATLEIENAQSDDLTDVLVQLQIWRQNDISRNSTMDLFAIGNPKLSELTAVDGSGHLVGQGKGQADWLIIPRPDAVPVNEQIFSVGGILRYKQGGVPNEVILTPGTITVKAQPQLVLHYFHEKYIYGDNPMTQNEHEMSIPFTLAVLVHNQGNGTARDLKITSAQPEIIENEKGLLIDFKIMSSQLGKEDIQNSFTIDFGDIESKDIKVARWLLNSTLSGTFFNFSASFENINPLGDPTLSLIEAVEYHELIRIVDLGEEPDEFFGHFLINDKIDGLGVPDAVFNVSSGTAQPVMKLTSESLQKQGEWYEMKFSLINDTASGWYYGRSNFVKGITAPPRSHKALEFMNEKGEILPTMNAWVIYSMKQKYPWISIFEHIEPSDRPDCCSYKIKFGLPDEIKTTTESTTTTTNTGISSSSISTSNPSTSTTVPDEPSSSTKETKGSSTTSTTQQPSSSSSTTMSTTKQTTSSEAGTTTTEDPNSWDKIKDWLCAIFDC